MLTPEELELCNKLADCYIAFCQLPIQHQNDAREFVSSIHALQKTIMARSAVREHPDVFHNEARE